MAQILGMNPQEVRDLARQLEQAAGEIDQIKTRLSSKLASTTWTGPDADRFSNEWNSTHTGELTRVSSALKTAGQTATRNAAAQESTSASL